MEITDSRIDGGKSFDWGRTSQDYARYRDIYPDEFYQRIVDRGLCVSGQRVLDLGQELAYFRGTCIVLVRTGSAPTFQRTRYSRQSCFPVE